ncbi:isochorismatase family protein [Salinimonas chungwhensis]|uniref:isochorismatase family protein n=1 Tax=Salinimonas chungwhensis TaxID=265425 RepID=UPI000374617B|nr:isochorismatase family protein [Salinimonas chungwhensis]
MFSHKTTGLVVVDIQGRLAECVDQSDAFVASCEKLICAARALDLPVIWLEQIPEKLGPTHPSIRELLQPLQPITKYTFNAFDTPAFCDAVASSGLSDWLVCGTEAHVCVFQTALSLFQHGYNIQVPEDCIASRTFANKARAIARLQASGVTITSLEMCLFELIKDCRHPKFQTILKLIK